MCDVFNSCLSVGNTLILVALHKESSLHPPSKLLFRQLAATDLCVGIIGEPLIVVYWMFVAKKKWNICRYPLLVFGGTSSTLCAVSLLITTGISVDRLLALLLGLRYRQVVTLKRTYAAITAFWFVSIVSLILRFFLINPASSPYIICIGIVLCLVTSSYCYTNIFLTLHQREHQVQTNNVQGERSQNIPLNIARYRRTVSSALWVQFTLLICYFPYVVVEFLTMQIAPNSAMYLAWQVTLTLVYFNSSLNPILYCWKIREVRQAVKETIRQMFCSWS